MKRVTSLALLAALGTVAVPTFAQTVKLKPILTGGMKKIGYYMPQRITLSEKIPVGLKQGLKGAKGVMYGTLNFGQGPVIVAVKEMGAGKSMLYVDANRDGNLNNDPPVTWTATPYGQKQEFMMHQGGLPISLKAGKGAPAYGMVFYAFDSRDTQRAQLKNALLYYRDYLMEGELTLGEKSYHVMLDDSTSTGNFSLPTKKTTGKDTPGISLLIDVNGNGKIDSRGEVYAAGKPFNIGGTTYEIKKIAADGSTLEIGKSAQNVAEILPPPTLTTGKAAIAFDVKTTAGDAISFPKSYPGKVVMLDFWATWCGPCIGELPGLTKAYETYHKQGFEILGISLDQENAATKLADFTKAKSMTWAQVYDGKYWGAEVAQLYVIQSIPSAFLVDGDTGLILAQGNELRGDQLAPTLERVLKAKGK